VNRRCLVLGAALAVADERVYPDCSYLGNAVRTNPHQALSDGPTPGRWRRMKALLATLKALDDVVKRHGFVELAL